MGLFALGQDLQAVLFEPGMQDGSGHRDHPCGADLAGGRTKERQQFGRASALVLMWLQSRVAFGLPRGPRLRNGLIRPSLVFVQLHDPRGFRLLAGELDQSLFSGVSGS
jgi:hypothetical protein